MTLVISPLKWCRRGSTPGRSLAALAFCVGAVVVPGRAHAQNTAHSGYCRTDTGREFQVVYSRHTDAVVYIAGVFARPGQGQPYATFAEDAGTKIRYEWWSPATFFALNGSSYASWQVTGVGGPASDPQQDDFYNQWWAGVSGLAGVTSSPMYEFVNPRVTFRTTTSFSRAEDRDEDFCDVFVGPYTPGSGSNPPRVAHIGDSISAQMAPVLFQLHAAQGRRFFIEAQSGTKYGDNLGEARGMDAGLRDVDGVHRPPQVLTVALGTNEVFWEGRGAHATGGSAWETWKTNTTLKVLRLLLDTSRIGCRVLMTVRNIPGDTHQIAAADWFNALIRQFDQDNTSIRTVDWQAAASTHASDWYNDATDILHPTTAGLNALTSRIMQQETCCLTPNASGC